MKKEIVYVGDPLCGWCFGFTDVFEKVMKKYNNSLNFSIVMGGLKVEDSIHINETIKDLIYQNWVGVMNKTGQTFAVDLIASLPEGYYNSEPPCRAVVTVKHLKPESAISYYKSLHKAMYLQAKNNTSPDLLSELAVRAGISKNDFNTHFYSDEIKTKTQKEFEFSKKSGVLGFPAFILIDETGSFVLNQGYKPFKEIEKGIESWLKGEKTIIF